MDSCGLQGQVVWSAQKTRVGRYVVTQSGGQRGQRHILCCLSLWKEKAGLSLECGRTFKSLLRISRDGGVWTERHGGPGQCQGQTPVSTLERVRSAQGRESVFRWLLSVVFHC